MYFTASSEVIIHSPSIIAAVKLNNMFGFNNSFSLGIQAYLDFWDQQEKISGFESKITGHNSSVKIGFIYDIGEKTSIGLTYSNGIDIKGKLQNSAGFFERDTLMGNNPQIYASTNMEFIFKLPSRWSFGLSTHLDENMLLSTCLNSVQWKELNNDLKNQIEFSANLIYRYSKDWDFSIGLFASDLEYD